MEPRPTDIMMQEYCSRRLSHLTKMCMAISASRRSTRLITHDDVTTAQEMLFEAERGMPLLLRRFGMSDAGRFMDTLLEFAQKKKDYFKMSLLRREATRTASKLGDVEPAITNLLDCGLLVQEGDLVKAI